MNGELRRKEIIKRLTGASAPISASALATQLGVSRQVIVQDVALLRATGTEIVSLARGYRLPDRLVYQRVFKVYHSDEDVERELNLVVDLGGSVKDVFVYHRAYDIIRAPMGLHSRADVQRFLTDISSGKSSLLKNITCGYHYHTIEASDTATLDRIAGELKAGGFLADLKEYEPAELTEQD